MRLKRTGKKLWAPAIKLNSEDMFGLDLLRVAAAFMVYLFHININLKFQTGVTVLDRVFSVGAIFMVCFFMLSGFVFSYRYGQTDLLAAPEKLKSFYKKRLLRIYPAYLLFLLIVFLFHLSFPADAKVLATLIPMDLLSLQAFFPKGWSWLGNGGTWFISVLFFLYLLYPFLQKLLNTYVCWQFWKPALACYIVMVYIAFARIFIGGDFAAYYANPIFRVPEFMLGMLLGQRQREKPFEIQTKKPAASIWITLGTCLGIAVLYFVGVVALYEKKVWDVDFFKNNYLSYNIIAVPLFAAIIVLLSNLKTGMVPAVIAMPVNFLSRLSFYFYLTQTLANRLTAGWIKNAYWGFAIDGDKKILLVTLCLNLLFAMLMYLIVEKIIDRELKKIFV